VSLRRSRAARVVKQLIQSVDARWWWVQRRIGWRSRPRVLFEVYNWIGFAAQAPVLELLRARGNLDLEISGAHESDLSADIVQSIEQSGIPLLRVAEVRNRRYDLIVVTDSPRLHAWRCEHVAYLPHGSGVGNLAIPYAVQMLDCGDANYLLAANVQDIEYVTTQFGTRFQGCARVTGLPKLDRLATSPPDRVATLRSLGLDPSRPTILLMSHWTPGALLRREGDAILAVLRARTECNVIVTGHPHLWTRQVGPEPVDWHARLRWIDDVPHMRFVPQAERLFELMAAADIAITDYTSATLEYAILQRPIIYFHSPVHGFADAELVSLLQQSTLQFETIAEFRVALASALANPVIDPVARARLLAHCFEHLGEATQRAALAIEDLARDGVLLDDEPTPLPAGSRGSSQ
jgi:CDP-glycerol:poly(glycerophosphate) glycerophosphotransferase